MLAVHIGLTLTAWQEGTRAKAARRAANRFRAFAARSPLPPSSSAYDILVPSSSSRKPYPASASRIRVTETSSRTATPQALHKVRRDTGTAYSPLVSRGGITSSTSMPLIYSASRLRKEVGTPPRRSAVSTTGLTPLPVRTGSTHNQVQSQPLPTVTGRSRRGSRIDPESIELPPSSSATGPSSTSSSPLAHQSPLPPAQGHTSSLVFNANQEQDEGKSGGGRKHDRRKSRSRDAFEEGILKEMRERLAAAGLGGDGSARK